MLIDQPLADAASRVRWFDAARGVAIVLVVFGHCWRGLHGSNLIDDDRLYAMIDGAIYLFHMPLMFVLAGMMFPRSFKLPFGRFVARRAIRLLYPLVLWTYLFGIGKLIFDSYANTPMNAQDFPWVPVPPLWQFWFLWALFVLSIALGVVCRITRAQIGPPLNFLIFLLIASYLLNLSSWNAGVFDPYLRSAVLFAPYFLLGAVLGSLPELPPVPPLLAALLFTGAIAMAISIPMTTALRILVAIAAVVAVIALCRALTPSDRETRFQGPLVVMGAESMAIYLARTFFSAPTRAALLIMDIDSLTAHLALGTIAGLIGPMLLLWVSNRMTAKKLLGF